MARKLFTVEAVFLIEGRGVFLAPGIVPEGSERFRAGDTIELRRPDGNRNRTSIAGLDLPTPNPRHVVVVSLPRNFRKDDVPIGTEVWSID
jgi:hypothetical protein